MKYSLETNFRATFKYYDALYDFNRSESGGPRTELTNPENRKKRQN
ncbi:hypothetical protein QUF80_04235 [Desulfococcaceae bacterium HSG8]|nr:hypothetical protein [Desulfococcaceae bacterium HSG8]